MLNDNLGQVTTPIQAGNLYDPQHTQWARNQLVADANRNSLRFLQKPFDRPGVARSAGSIAAAMPGFGQSKMAAMLAGIQQPFADDMANAQFNLSGQSAQFQDTLGQAGNLNQLQNNRNNLTMQLLSLLTGGM